MSSAPSTAPVSAPDPAPGPASAPEATAAAGWRRHRRALLWIALVLLLLVAQSLLVGLTVNYEASRAQEDTDAVAIEVGAEARRDLVSLQQQLQSLAAQPASGWPPAAQDLLRTPRHGEVMAWRLTPRPTGKPRGQVRVATATEAVPVEADVVTKMPNAVLPTAQAGAFCRRPLFALNATPSPMPPVTVPVQSTYRLRPRVANQPNSP